MNKTILVVDDDVHVRRMIATMLKTAGLEPIEAADGPAALTVLGTLRIDLLVTDLRLPAMDGVALIAQVRADPHCAGLPILVLSGYTDTAARPVPADRTLVKPFDMAELVQTVNEMLALRTPEPAF